MNRIKYILALSVLPSLTACFEIFQSSGSNTKQTEVIEESLDTDGDGVLDKDDNWPTDPDLPITSTLWGAYGEEWSPDSRLPFFGFAGYRDGADLPNVSRIVTNVVVDHGATPEDGSANDTTAFLNALADARTQVSADNPGVLFVPAGVYDIDKQLHMDVSGLVLRGEGVDETILRFTTGVATDDDAIGVGSGPTDLVRRKLIVMGGKYDGTDLHIGMNWQQTDSDYSAALDTANLPSRGDFELRLSQPLSSTLKQNIIDQGNRIRLQQPLHYSYNTTNTPSFAASIYGSPNGIYDTLPETAASSAPSQQFVVTISDDEQTLILDRPLRFSPTAETYNDAGVRIAVRQIDSDYETEEVGVEYLTIELPNTPWTVHNGTEGQGGIEVLSDNSWVQHVRLINADNGIEMQKETFNITLSDITISSTRQSKTSGPAGARYEAHGHHGVTLKGRSHLLRDFVIENSYIHDITANNCHGCVFMRGSAVEMNMDHHRQTIYSSLWAELNLGKAFRMWASTGNKTEGFNAAAYNTYWNISNSEGSQSWPEDYSEGTVFTDWGYHRISIIGTGIQSKPAANEGNRPFPYDPANAHLETMSQAELWPQNLYEAQREAYLNGDLAQWFAP